MKSFVKRTLLFTVLVLCMLGAFALAASATAYDDDAAAIRGDAVARVGAVEGGDVYYESFDNALTAALSGGGTEITLLKNATWSAAQTVNSSVTIKGATKDIVLTAQNKGNNLKGNATLKFENLTIAATPNWFDANEPLALENTNTLIFDNVIVNITKVSSPNLIFLSAININIEITDCEFNLTGGSVNIFNVNSTATVVEMTVRNTTFNSADLTLFNLGGAAYGIASSTAPGLFENVTSISTNLVSVGAGSSYINISGGSFEPNSITGANLSFAGDEEAKGLGYFYRVGEVVGGKTNEVYFNRVMGAFEVADAAGGLPVYDISGAAPLPQGRPNADDDFMNDGEAKNSGYIFRVGETQGGDKGVVYFNAFTDALEAVPDGGSIYVLNGFSVSAVEISLDKSFSLIGIGLKPGQQHIVAHSGDTHMFLINSGTASSPITVTMENLFFDSPGWSGFLFAIEDDAYTNLTLKNCGLRFSERGGIRVQGNANATLNIDGGDYTCYILFKFLGNIKLNFNVTGGAVFKSSGLVSDSSLVYIDTSSAQGDVKINFKDVEMLNAQRNSTAMWLLNSSKADITMENVYIRVATWCIDSQKNTVPRLNLKNVEFISVGATPIRMRGASGASVNIFGGTFASEASASAFNSTNGFAIVNFGEYMTANFYDGFFQSNVAPLISALNTTVTINIYGGTYSCTSIEGSNSPISLPTACTLNVYGGIFRNASRTAPVFSNVVDANGSLTLYGYHAYGNANLIANLGLGTPSALHSGLGASSYNTILATRGAKPVFLQDGVALGFKATVSAETFQYLQGLALNGELRFGMLIVETDKITDGMTFTHYGLSSNGLTLDEDFFEVTASYENLADGSWAITADYEIAAEDLNTAYSVVFFAEMEDAVSGAPFYLYSAYEKTQNSRSLAQVALAAYNDTSETQDAFYANPVDGTTGVYSPYTAAQLAALSTVCGGNTTQKELDVFLVAGGSNAVGNAPYNSSFAEGFDQSTISSNIFYSGLIGELASQTYGKQVLNYMASNYTAIGATPALGLGWSEGTLGFEVGMAQKLSELYNADSGKYAAIIKYAVNDATLVGGGADDMRSWNNLYDSFISMVSEQIADYEGLGYKVNVVGMYWMQGEQDVANANAYTAAFNTLISKIRTDIADMPVVVGEIATFVNLKTNDLNTAFVEMQNDLAADDVIIDATSLYMADANGIFNSPNEVIAIGARVAATIVKNGSSSIDPAVLDAFQIPELELVADILVGGNSIGSVTSMGMALAKAPAGATIKLKTEQTIYSAIELSGLSNITLDGNGMAVNISVGEPGFILKDSSVIFNNFKLVHTGANVGIRIDANSSVVIGGDSYIETNLTAIELTGRDSQLVITGGTFKTTNENGQGSIIYTSNADIQISGGTFEAAAGTSCVVIDKNAPTRLAVNIVGGSFKTTEAELPATSSDGTVIPDEMVTLLPGAFVNACPVAILVIDPTVQVDAVGPTVNNGLDA